MNPQEPESIEPRRVRKMADIINQIKVKENHKRQEIMLEGENDESSSSGSDSDPSDDEFEVNYFNSNI